MFCTFCYHGDCHVARAQPARVCVCGRAISRAQILKLFSEETTAKGATPTIPSLVSSRFLFPLPLIFLTLLPSSSSATFLPPLSREQPLPRCTPTRPSCTPMATARRWMEGRILTDAAGCSSSGQPDLRQNHSENCVTSSTSGASHTSGRRHISYKTLRILLESFFFFGSSII